MKTIKLAVFNETYWDKGLIYSQNLLPLLNLAEKTGDKIELISFTSIAMMILKHKEIKITKEELGKRGVVVSNFPMLFYPTRFMLLKIGLIPLFFVNVFLYIKWLCWKDRNQDVVYSVRSYQAALAFLKFYTHKKNVVFDLRTDWIEENINRGLFSADSITARYWYKQEKAMLIGFAKSLFISPAFMDNVLKRHNIPVDTNKYHIVYNPIDYKHFESGKQHNKKNIFLYTGSLGHWNQLENYLDFFKSIYTDFFEAELIICTNSPKAKVESIINKKDYSAIKPSVKVFYNVSYQDLPKIYAQCRYGLQIMTKQDSRVGVKVIEYVAADIVPIVHSNVQGAAALINETKVGVVFDDSDKQDNKLLIERIKAKSDIDKENEGYKAFKSLTDLNEISKQLINIYG